MWRSTAFLFISGKQATREVCGKRKFSGVANKYPLRLKETHFAKQNRDICLRKLKLHRGNTQKVHRRSKQLVCVGKQRMRFAGNQGSAAQQATLRQRCTLITNIPYSPKSRKGYFLQSTRKPDFLLIEVFWRVWDPFFQKRVLTSPRTHCKPHWHAVFIASA